ncbi:MULTISPECIES: MBL fold metallo-hydrolase [Myroides]|uniref:MBL fold metallo-hydrolase n=1 Tax=Myroides albus TaxID=2562892 RepID=A0A6I3LR12_9FLAO|nr:MULTISPECIES: MBL fold metallo-hydrolase [Myroides]MTG98405.1 MBL fold metallo-hydrolase [Myroides albus]MVX36792.1 MBL fold metallo-hydrolase [Myroides sp. LoEW2-1]UVD79683.1 MBL fold metallo-hydrolase [Myroides albus]
MNIDVLHINAKSAEGEPAIFNPVVVGFSDGTSYLIDCGFTYNFSEFKQELRNLGLMIADLKGIIISHDDIDHLEGLHCFKKEYIDLEVISSVEEADSVSGRVDAERLVQVRESLNHIPEEMKQWVNNFIVELEAVKRFEVTSTLVDGQFFKDTLQVIATPGHTKGHLSFFDIETRTLIASDAIVVEDGEFNIANPQFTLDLPAALASVRKLKELNPERIICFHGGMVEEDIEGKLSRLIEKFE